jgi:NhaP-type Na+/H+ or K+/H+ antiporter
MVFVAVGILCGPSVLGIANFNPESEAGLLVAEIALVIVLFSDASRSDLGELRSDGALSARLLAIGMPLTMVAGTIAAAVFLLGLEFWEGAVIAAVLAPTDAALGHAVVSSKLVPEKIRQTINVEAGLNDGLSIPFLFLFLGLAVDQASIGAVDWFTFGIEQIAIGAAIGILVGGGGGWLVDQAIHKRAMTHTFQRLSMVALAIGAWALADSLGGNGFIAAFVAGLAVARFRKDFGERMLDFAEREGQLLSLVVFFVFGTAAIGYMGEATWGVIAFAALALTLVRMVPVAVALAGTGLSKGSIAFIGWFGPRGLASIILVLVVVEEEPGLPGLDVVIAATTVTVLASVFLHGISARPLARAYSAHVKTLPDDALEHDPALDEVKPRKV